MNSDARPGPREDRTDAEDISWSHLKALFDAALELHGEDRELFIESSCGENVKLRQELESLLQSHGDTSGFLDQPIVSVKSLLDTEVLPSAEADKQIGARVGAYRLEKEIGRGGMGEVYLATRADSEFDQRVAIKLIRDGSESSLAIRRFRQERQILARLDNAYIARLLDGGTTAGGLPYFVMEYVEGQPISQYCDANSLTARDRLNLFIKVCSAVQYAHERNIIHRDLKPGNILVKTDGTPKLLDFGIAKILGAESSGVEVDATQHAFRILTPAYASPEQLRGGSATIKSDIYSLGVILYELLCGKRTDHAYLQRADIYSLCTQEPHMSTHLRAIVLRSVHPDPSERYASVESFSGDIRRYLGGSPPVANTPDDETESTAKVSLAILPFRIVGDQTSAHAFLTPGITEALITRLSRIERLSIPPPSAVLKYAEGVEAVRAARELHVEYVLEGSLRILGENVRASVQLVFAEAGIAVWAGQVEATETTLLNFEDAVAEQVANAILPHLTGEERAEISRSGTASGAAHAAYLRGRWHWNNAGADQERLLKALLCFMEAIEIDPKFARAHAGVADYHLRMGLSGGVPPSESFAAALKSAETAVKLEPALGEAHASLAFAIWAYHRDEEAAERHFTLATIRNPNYASAHHWFGLLNSSRNRPELAIANLERAQTVDPNSVLIAAALGFVYYNARQFDTALRLLLDAARELPKSGVIQEMLTWCYLQTGAVTQALESGRRAVELAQRSSAALCALAHAEAGAGNLAAAVELTNEIEGLTGKMYVSSYDRALASLAVGNVEQALQHLEQARLDRDWWLCWIEVDPRWDSLRREARFRKLLPKREPVKRGRLHYAPAAAALVAALAIILCLTIWLLRKPPVPFVNLKVVKLTSNGTAQSAVISPDGENVIFATQDALGTCLWRHDMNSRRTVKLVDHLSGKVGNLGYTDGGSAAAFVTYPVKDPSNRTLFKTPVAGGPVREIAGRFQGPVSLSLDGREAAYYLSDQDQGADEMLVWDLNSGKRRVLASYKYPQRFAWTCPPAWSPDRSQIAYAAEDRDAKGFLVRLYVVDTATGARHLVRAPRWQWVESIAWRGSKSALTVVGQEHESSFQQLWYLPYGRSEAAARPVGNDLDDYSGASLNARGSEIVSVQSRTLSNIYVAKPQDLSHPVQITAGSGRYFDLCWTPDNRILYASDATGSADLWAMNADGSGERQIVSGAGRNYAPTASPGSGAIAFHSNRSGNWQIWRADADGGQTRQLSSSVGDGNWPQFTPDGRAVLFHRTSPNGVFNIWRVPAEGGKAVQITSALTMHPAVSRIDGKIAAWYSTTIDSPQWKLAIFGPEGGQPLRVLNPTPHARPDTPIRWTPKGDAISFLDYAHSASNIWILPINGRPPHPLTTFDSGEIYSFDWSPTGSLIYSRGLTTADVVLIRDLNASEGSR